MKSKLSRDYRDDLDLFEGPWSRGLAFALLAGLVALAAFGDSFTVYVVTRIAVLAIAAIGLNLLTGYTGQISLGHAAFLAIGAYTHTILYTKGAPLLLAALAGAGLSAVFGFLVGIPALRLKGPYLAIATLGFQVAVDQTLARWSSVTGGRMGLGVPRPELFVPLSPRVYFLLCLAITTIVIVLAYNLVRSRIGRAFVAVRDNDTAAEATGIALTRTKTLAFAISAGVTGLAGALLVHLGDSINPSNFTLLDSIELLVMIMVGGFASISGSVIGAALIVVLGYALSGFRDFTAIITGVILISVILFEPMGLRGRWLRIKLYFRTWPF